MTQSISEFNERLESCLSNLYHSIQDEDFYGKVHGFSIPIVGHLEVYHNYHMKRLGDLVEQVNAVKGTDNLPTIPDGIITPDEIQKIKDEALSNMAKQPPSDQEIVEWILLNDKIAITKDWETGEVSFDVLGDKSVYFREPGETYTQFLRRFYNTIKKD